MLITPSELIRTLHDIGCFKFGSFKLKNGDSAPFVFDFRVILGYPKVMEMLSDAVWQKISHLQIDRICAIPYAAHAVASHLCIKHNIPLLIKRRDLKESSSKPLIEGPFKEGDSCLIIEDVITSGNSILEAINCLQSLGLNVIAVTLLLDREQGGRLAIEKQGCPVLPLLTLTEAFTHLTNSGKLSQKEFDKAKDFVEQNQIEF